MLNVSAIATIDDSISIDKEEQTPEYIWLAPVNLASRQADVAGVESFDPLERRAFEEPAPRASRSEEPTPGYLAQDVTRFFYKWGGHFSAALIRLRVRFDGDLDQYVIYLIFVLAELSLALAAAGGRGAPGRRQGLNALSVAEITRIPRETTRRKLQALVASGYLVRGADGLHYLAERYGLDEVFHDLSPLFWDAVKVERPT